jgi:hypothetical protein
MAALPVLSSSATSSSGLFLRLGVVLASRVDFDHVSLWNRLKRKAADTSEVQDQSGANIAGETAESSTPSSSRVNVSAMLPSDMSNFADTRMGVGQTKNWAYGTSTCRALGAAARFDIRRCLHSAPKSERRNVRRRFDRDSRVERRPMGYMAT